MAERDAMENENAAEERFRTGMNRADEMETTLPKYEYPTEVIGVQSMTAAARGGLDMEIMPEELYWLRQLDCQRTRNKGVYGTGFLAARNVADKIQAAAARERIQWELSEREREIVRRLGCGRKDEDG